MKKILEFLVTGCYSGYSPVAPGTAGTIVAIPFYLILTLLTFEQYMMVLLGALLPGVLLCYWGEKFFQEEDPSPVVIDEIIGFWVTMAAIPVSITTVICGFFLFRFFDVIKPYPVYQSQKLSYGIGVLIDDVLAGIYANLSLWSVYLLYKFFS